jgi:hypothetical protein
MLARLVALIIVGLLSAFGATASANTYESPLPFDGRFERDVEGGYFTVGRNAQAEAAFLGGQTVAADFQIMKAYRTEDFGSGVGFVIFDERKRQYTRIAIRDVEDSPNIAITIQQAGPQPFFGQRRFSESKLELSMPKASPGTMSLRHAGGRVMLAIDGKTIPVVLGFEPAHLMVQIYCSKAWVEFEKQNLVS